MQVNGTKGTISNSTGIKRLLGGISTLGAADVIAAGLIILTTKFYLADPLLVRNIVQTV
ncbi:MAG: hypothetical protein WA667_28370 [Candidatus Nitrosopolaris sp.]